MEAECAPALFPVGVVPVPALGMIGDVGTVDCGSAVFVVEADELGVLEDVRGDWGRRRGGAGSSFCFRSRGSRRALFNAETAGSPGRMCVEFGDDGARAADQDGNPALNDE